MNRLEVTVSNIQTARLNTAAANSRIRDVDVAEETSKLAREQVLAQAGTAILAQANQLPQIALSLLGSGAKASRANAATLASGPAAYF